MVRITTYCNHLCPVKDERDSGEVEIFYDEPSRFIELHDLRAFLDGYEEVKITHEELTDAIKRRYVFADVSTRWLTAGCEIEVTL